MTNQPSGHSDDAIASAGDVAQLGNDQRLLCPAEVRRVAKWLARGEPGHVYAELVEAEHIRLWPVEAVSSRLEKLKAGLQEQTDSEEVLRALADRYRMVARHEDARVRLTEAVLLYLGVTPGERPYLYVQGSNRSAGIDVMSLRQRDALQARHRASTAI